TLFVVSTDNGGHWRGNQGPGASSQCPPAADERVTDPRVLDDRTFLVTIKGQRFLSTHAEGNWSKIQAQPVIVDGFSPGARLIECKLDCAQLGGVQAVDVVHGRLEQLRAISGLRQPAVVLGVGDQTIWAAGRDYTGAAMVAWSTDAG